MADAVAKIEVKLAPSLKAILHIVGDFSRELNRRGADDEIKAAWLRCVEEVMESVRVAPNRPSRYEVN